MFFTDADLCQSMYLAVPLCSLNMFFLHWCMLVHHSSPAVHLKLAELQGIARFESCVRLYSAWIRSTLQGNISQQKTHVDGFVWMLQAVAWNIRQVRDLCSKFRKSDEAFFHELCRPCTRFFHWHERAAAALFWYDAIIAPFLTLQVQRLQRHAAGRTLYAIVLMARVLLYHSFCIRLFFKQIWGFLLRSRAEVLFLGGTGALVWWTGVARVLEADSALASFCYMAGVAASIWMLRRRNIQELLKDDESSLDMYLDVSLIATFTFTDP